MPPFLSVVIPAYNEATNIRAGALESVQCYLASQPYEHEVIVVDDGSLDETAALAESFAAAHPSFRVLRNPHRGKAYTVATGLRAAVGQVVLFTDMDQATPIHEVARLLPWYEQGYDVVIGSRGSYRRNAPLWRKAMSRSQMVLRNLILGFRDITDTQCGFKSFRGSVIAPILDNLHLYRFANTPAEVQGATVTAGFDVELLFVAQRLGYRIKEVPVEWDYRHSRRVNLLRDSVRGLRELVEIRLADARGAYPLRH
ncbi:MAG: glycosyltransferase [Anaerolineae bacterium]|nr:glycosyltransferase [Thermoflexales bacterium]MDW8396354.1 glycosyltransferase [Anaerolineae bacterium]